MRVSAKGEYAVRAMLDLALHRGTGLVAIQDVARRQDIPQRYLEQVLLQLKRAGYLRSRRGMSGGYELAHPAEKISVGDILRAVEGESMVDGTRETRRGKRAGAGAILGLWRKVGEVVAQVVDGTSLSDLADRARAEGDLGQPMYHI